MLGGGGVQTPSGTQSLKGRHFYTTQSVFEVSWEIYEKIHKID